MIDVVVDQHGLRAFQRPDDGVHLLRDRFWIGMVLVLCFSIGLAITLLASGTVAAWGLHHAARRWPGFDAFARKLPYMSSAIVILMGLYVGWSGLTHLA